MHHSEAAVITAVTLAQDRLTEGKSAAVVNVGDSIYIDDDYWNDSDQFTKIVADREAPAGQGVFVVPMLVQRDSDQAGYRPHGPAEEGEVEEFFILAWHIKSGLDIGRCIITRSPAGTPIFGELEVYQGNVQLPDSAPGIGLMRALLPTEETV